MLAIRSIRPSTALPRLLSTRLYSTNLPAKPAPPGTLGDPTPESSVGRIIEPFTGGYHSQGTSVARTIRNIWKAGFKRAFWQIKELNDTKAGTLIGTDRLGNKYYEDMGELPLRERWVEYGESHEYDSTQIEPGWHAWMTYMANEPPTLDKTLDPGSTNPKWEVGWRGTATQTDGAYRPYSTVKLKVESANGTLTTKARV